MDLDTIYKNLITEFGLETLSAQDQENHLFQIAQAIQKQFFADVYEKIGDERFEALEASTKMGEEFYATTLKHLLPEYEEVFAASRKKIVDAYKNAHPESAETPTTDVVH